MVANISDYFLYRWRYLLGYGVIILMMVGLFAVAWLLIPGGLTVAEMNSAITSSAFSFSIDALTPASMINLPYHVLQYLSFKAFGMSDLTIKLPSLILGLFSALGILMLLRMWFKQNVAVITTVLVVTTSQFLFLAQDGTPTVLYVFWTVWILVFALMVSRQARGALLWKVGLFIVTALSLYTPLEIYILLALLSAVVLHPHLRYIVKQLSKGRLAFATVLGLVLLAPLAYALVKQPSLGLQLLGIPTEPLHILTNVKTLFSQYFAFLSPGGQVTITPVYGLGTWLLIVLGVVRLFTTKYTARGYITIAWSILLLPVIIVNPQYVSVTFIPVVLLMAMGVSLLITKWYRLFPRNPYARIAGLVPLAIVIGGMVFSGVDRYMYGYTHIPAVANQFSDDLTLLNKKLADKNLGTTLLVVAPGEEPFYRAVVKFSPHVKLTSSVITFPADTLIVSRDGRISQNYQSIPNEIIANDKYKAADRFYIYTIPKSTANTL